MRATADEGWKSEALSIPQQETVSPGDTIRSHRAGSSSYRLGTAEIVQVPAWDRICPSDRPCSTAMYHRRENTECSPYEMGTDTTAIFIQNGIHKRCPQ